MKQVGAVDQYGGFVVADVGSAKGLPNTVDWRDRIAVHDRHLNAFGLSPGDECLMKVRKAEQDGATVTSGSDDQKTERPSLGAVCKECVRDFHDELRRLYVRGSGQNAELVLDGDVQDCDDGDKRRREDDIHDGFS
jgi:hypothetical protein